jgi:AcrR family transcriptional regulator
LKKKGPTTTSSVLKRGRRTVIDFDSDAVERLLDAAETVFANEGFAGAIMDDIATLAGLTKATIYYHIGNKEAIYQQILKRHFSRFADRLENELSDCDDPLEGLRGVVRIHCEEFDRSLASTRTISHELANNLAHANAEVQAIVWRILEVTRRFVDLATTRGMLPPLDPVVVHHLLVGPLLLNAMVVPIPLAFAELPSGWKPPVSQLAALGQLISQVVIPGLAVRK